MSVHVYSPEEYQNAHALSRDGKEYVQPLRIKRAPASLETVKAEAQPPAPGWLTSGVKRY